MPKAKPVDDANRVNQRSLKTLLRAIQLSQGQFSLILVRCNYTSLRDRMVQQAIEESAVPIQVFTLPDTARTLYTALHDAFQESADTAASSSISSPFATPPATFLLGLESVQDLEQLLTSTNQVREEFRKHCPFPLVLWVNDRVLQQMTQLAPDFKAWAATSIRFEMAIPDLITSLRDHADRLFASILDLGDERFLSNTVLAVEHNTLRRTELEFALNDIRNSGHNLTGDLQASLDFLLGRDAHARSELETARDAYERSLQFWQSQCGQIQAEFQAGNLAFSLHPSCLERAACVLFHLGLLWRAWAVLQRVTYDHSLRQARQYFQASLELFTQANRQDLVAKFIIALAEVYQKLEQWQDLEQLAQKALVLHQLFHDPVRQARDHGFLAEVALARSDWTEAVRQVEMAQTILQTAETELQALSQPLASPQEEALELAQRYHQGLYLFLLARAEASLGQIDAAITHLETALHETFPKDDPFLYIQMLGQLRELLFQKGRYLDAFHTKQLQRSLEYQYGLRAFVGALRLRPQQHLLSPAKGGLSPQETVAQEIAASGRAEDVQTLWQRLGRTDLKLTVIHGPSGVGKSSILFAGLLPLLQSHPIDSRLAHLVVIDTYTNWQSQVEKSLAMPSKDAATATLEAPLGNGNGSRWSDDSVFPVEPLSFQMVATRDMPPASPEISPPQLIARLRAIAQTQMPILIFDQFEEFFFVHDTVSQRRSFYEFLRDSLYTDYVKVILLLREDYLHYLLEFQRFASQWRPQPDWIELDSIRDILGKDVRYSLEDFSPDRAREVIRHLTAQAQFYLEEALIDELVTDLADELGQVRPIELQIVGAELQTEGIHTLADYRRKGPKQKLVQKSLETVVRDCGPENEAAARSVLFLLTHENGARPLKTRSELEADLIALNLEAEIPRLDLVLEVLVGAGLVFLLPDTPSDRYQLVHDYLVSFIRQQQSSELTRLQVELEQERSLRRLTETELRQTVIRLEASLENQEFLTDSLSAEALLNSHLDLEALLKAVATGQRLRHSVWAEPALRLRTIAALRQVLYSIHECNRLQGHQDWVTSISFSPNGDRLASASADGSIKLWNLEGKELQTLPSEAGPHGESSGRIYGVSFSPDGQLLAWASADSSIKLWNLEGKELQTLKGHKGSVSSVCFSPDGSILASASSDGTIRLWSLDGRELSVLEGHSGSVRSISFSPDGRVIASGSTDDTLKLWAIDRSVALAPIAGNEVQTLAGHGGDVRSVSFSPDGQWLVSASADGTVKLWRPDGQEVRTLKGHEGWVRSVAFSPDSQQIASAGADGAVRLWSLDGSELATFKGHKGRVNCVCFSANGQILASASDDGMIKFWSVSGQPLQVCSGHQESINSVQFSPDGRLIASASDDGTVKLWTLVDGQPIQTLSGLNGRLIGASFSPDGQRLAVAGADSTVTLISLQGAIQQTFKRHGGRVNQVVFSPNGQTLASASADGTVKLWDGEGHLLRTLKGHSDWVIGVCFSPNGQHLASASGDGTVKLWTLEGQEQATCNGHVGGVRSVCFSPDGYTLASASDDGTIKLWRLDGLERLTLKGHSSSVWCVSFSPDGNLLASASGDGTVKLWSLDGQELKTLKGHVGGVWSVCFSPSGLQLASAGLDRRVIVWNLDLDDLLAKGCAWLRDYLQHNPKVSPSDRSLCLS